MKSKQTNKVRVDAVGGSAFSTLCLRSCRKILAQIRKAKEAIFSEARGTLDTHERMLQLALNEAEALAWQTEPPDLVFPALAAEKSPRGRRLEQTSTVRVADRSALWLGGVTGGQPFLTTKTTNIQELEYETNN